MSKSAFWRPALEHRPTAAEKQKRIVEASIVLIENTEDGSWDLIWPAITSNAEYGREFLLEFAHFDSNTQVGILAKKLSENAVAELYTSSAISSSTRNRTNLRSG